MIMCFIFAEGGVCTMVRYIIMFVHDMAISDERKTCGYANIYGHV